MVPLLPAVYSLGGLALLDFAGALDVRGSLGSILGLGTYDPDQMDLELGQLEQEINGVEQAQELGVVVTPRNIARLQARLRKLKAKLKYAKTDGQKRRYQRRIERLEEKLKKADAKVERRIERREGKGKEATRRQKAAAELLKSRKEKKEERAKARAVEKGKIGVDAIKGVPYRVYLKYIRVLEPRVRAATRSAYAMGAMTGVAVARYEAGVNQVVAASGAKGAQAAGAIEHFKKNRAAYVARWLGKTTPASSGSTGLQAPVFTPPVAAARPQLPVRVAANILPPAVLQARLARRAAVQNQIAQMQAQAQQLAQMQAQAASYAQQQALAQQRAQYQQQLAAMQQQMAQFSVPSSPTYIPQSQLFAPSAASQQSGAFQAFPHSTPIESSAEAEADEKADNGEDTEGAEGEGEAEDQGATEEGDDTPFYKKPLFLLLAAGGIGAAIYMKNKKKDGKDKEKKQGTPSAA